MDVSELTQVFCSARHDHSENQWWIQSLHHYLQSILAPPARVQSAAASFTAPPKACPVHNCWTRLPLVSIYIALGTDLSWYFCGLLWVWDSLLFPSILTFCFQAIWFHKLESNHWPSVFALKVRFWSSSHLGKFPDRYCEVQLGL
jgi:hypothetical protein